MEVSAPVQTSQGLTSLLKSGKSIAATDLQALVHQLPPQDRLPRIQEFWENIDEWDARLLEGAWLAWDLVFREKLWVDHFASESECKKAGDFGSLRMRLYTQRGFKSLVQRRHCDTIFRNWSKLPDALLQPKYNPSKWADILLRLLATLSHFEETRDHCVRLLEEKIEARVASKGTANGYVLREPVLKNTDVTAVLYSLGWKNEEESPVTAAITKKTKAKGKQKKYVQGQKAAQKKPSAPGRGQVRMIEEGDSPAADERPSEQPEQTPADDELSSGHREDESAGIELAGEVEEDASACDELAREREQNASANGKLASEHQEDASAGNQLASEDHHTDDNDEAASEKEATAASGDAAIDAEDNADHDEASEEASQGKAAGQNLQSWEDDRIIPPGDDEDHFLTPTVANAMATFADTEEDKRELPAEPKRSFGLRVCIPSLPPGDQMVGAAQSLPVADFLEPCAPTPSLMTGKSQVTEADLTRGNSTTLIKRSSPQQLNEDSGRPATAQWPSPLLPPFSPEPLHGEVSPESRQNSPLLSLHRSEDVESQAMFNDNVVGDRPVDDASSGSPASPPGLHFVSSGAELKGHSFVRRPSPQLPFDHLLAAVQQAAHDNSGVTGGPSAENQATALQHQSALSFNKSASTKTRSTEPADHHYAKNAKRRKTAGHLLTRLPAAFEMSPEVPRGRAPSLADEDSIQHSDPMDILTPEGNTAELEELAFGSPHELRSLPKHNHIDEASLQSGSNFNVDSSSTAQLDAAFDLVAGSDPMADGGDTDQQRPQHALSDIPADQSNKLQQASDKLSKINGGNHQQAKITDLSDSTTKDHSDAHDQSQAQLQAFYTDDSDAPAKSKTGAFAAHEDGRKDSEATSTQAPYHAIDLDQCSGRRDAGIMEGPSDMDHDKIFHDNARQQSNRASALYRSSLTKITISSADLERLKPGYELNDSVVNAVLRLSNDYPDVIHIVDSQDLKGSSRPSHVRRCQLRTATVIIVPYHHPRLNHWSIFVIDQAQSQLVMTHYNSMGEQSNQQDRQTITAWLNRMYCRNRPSIHHRQGRCARQADAHNCGVFAIEVCRAIIQMRQLPSVLGADQIAQLRLEYTDLLQRHRTGADLTGSTTDQVRIGLGHHRQNCFKSLAVLRSRQSTLFRERIISHIQLKKNISSSTGFADLYARITANDNDFTSIGDVISRLQTLSAPTRNDEDFKIAMTILLSKKATTTTTVLDTVRLLIVQSGSRAQRKRQNARLQGLDTKIAHYKAQLDKIGQMERIMQDFNSQQEIFVAAEGAD